MTFSSNLSARRGNGWFILLGAVMILTGIGAFAFPLVASLSVELLVGATFLIGGIATVIMGFQMRAERNWGWLVASGGMSMLLGIMVFGGLANGASLGFIGVLLGVNFLLAGASFVALGCAKADTTSDQPEEVENQTA